MSSTRVCMGNGRNVDAIRVTSRRRAEPKPSPSSANSPLGTAAYGRDWVSSNRVPADGGTGASSTQSQLKILEKEVRYL
jgi:hypothetical protein